MWLVCDILHFVPCDSVDSALCGIHGIQMVAMFPGFIFFNLPTALLTTVNL
jgi:hypothetical protein